VHLHDVMYRRRLHAPGLDLHARTRHAEIYRTLRDGQMEIVQFEYNWRWLLNHACLRDVFEFIADKPYRLGKLVGTGLQLHDRWHAELDRFFETNYVLIRTDSPLCALGSTVQFDASNVGISVP